jgi:outer membrane protein OmpA-like peptidoglycan-associated protein
VGLTLLGISAAAACAHETKDKKPEMAKEHGYYLSMKESEERGGVGGYVSVPSNTERAEMDEQRERAGIAQANAAAAAQPKPAPAVEETIPALKDKPEVILFNLGDATLKEESLPKLDQLAAQMKAAPDVKVKVEGFTDSLGTPELNNKLAEERAESVSSYLEAKGAPKDCLEIASFGEDQAVQDKKGNPEDRKVIISLG